MRNAFTVAIAALITLIGASQAASAAQRVAIETCDAPAGVYDHPYYDLPPIADELGARGTAVVRVDLSATGMLVHEELYSSSGNWWLDDAALRSARLTRFTPEVIGCHGEAGSYLYRVDF
jgi:TonB family protein